MYDEQANKQIDEAIKEAELGEVKQPKLNRKGRRATKSLAGRWRKGPKKRPAWMNYCRDLHEAVIFKKVAGELGVSVPEMMRQATNQLINRALDDYRAANPQEFESLESHTSNQNESEGAESGE